MNKTPQQGALDPLIAALCARLEGDASGDDYVRSRQEALQHLDALENPPRIADEKQYRYARAVKSMLASLSCFTFNTKHPEDDRVWRLESEWGRELARYNRRFLVKDHETRAIARYLLWPRYWPGVDHRQLFDEAKRRGLLRKRRPQGRGDLDFCLYVVGLEMKVGDNTFTVDRHGRHYRHYNRSCARQAFHMAKPLDLAGPEDEATWLADVPALGENWTETSLGDGKFVARPVHLTRRERTTILRLFHPSYRQPSTSPPRAVAA
jgi:hypothetical protein